jgi:hypothetical protein
MVTGPLPPAQPGLPLGGAPQALPGAGLLGGLGAAGGGIPGAAPQQPANPLFIAAMDQTINSNLLSIDGMLAGVGLGIPLANKPPPGFGGAATAGNGVPQAPPGQQLIPATFFPQPDGSLQAVPLQQPGAAPVTARVVPGTVAPSPPGIPPRIAADAQGATSASGIAPEKPDSSALSQVLAFLASAIQQLMR